VAADVLLRQEPNKEEDEEEDETDAPAPQRVVAFYLTAWKKVGVVKAAP
jgi:hypothetical protein